jgi:hypothetical protein
VLIGRLPGQLRADAAVAAGLYVVAPRAKVFSAAAFEVDAFTRGAGPGRTHHELFSFTCGLCIGCVLARLIDDCGAADESLAPRRYPVDFYFETETQKGSDQNDDRENYDVIECGRHGDGSNEIAGDQDFEAQQDCPTE